MEKGIENPHVVYIPTSPGFPDENYIKFVYQEALKGNIHAIIFETYMSGLIPDSVFGHMSHYAPRIPTFVVPQALGQVEYPRTYDDAEYGKVTTLETAYSAIADQVVTKISEVLKRTSDVASVVAEVRDHFKQKESPSNRKECEGCGEWKTETQFMIQKLRRRSN